MSHPRVLIPSNFDQEQESGSIPKMSHDHEELVKLPDGVAISLIYGKCGRNIKELTARLPEHCEIIGRNPKGPFVVKGASSSAVAAGVRELEILIAVKKANFFLKFSEWKCIPVSSRPGSTELKCVQVDLDYPNHSTFGPQLKESECLYSLEVCQPNGSKLGEIPKETMDNILKVFLPLVSDALKGATGYVRMKARFGRILFRVDRQSELRKCPLSAVMEDGFLTDNAICKFLPKLKKRDGINDNALYTMVPQLPVHEQKLCTLINQVTVLLIDVVFFDANGHYEYAVLKCIKEEGGRFYKLVEVMKKPQEITCDCIFLECLHDVRITMNVCTAKDVEFSKAVKPTADWIVSALREQEDGSITIVTRGPEFAVVKVRRSEKTNYLYKHFQELYLLTETESKQCNVWSMEGKVPKYPYGYIIKFDDNIHKEVELFNPQWISNYSLLEQINVEEAFKRHFFDLHDCQQTTLTPKRPKEADFVRELQSFTNCALHIASYPSSQS